MSAPGDAWGLSDTVQLHELGWNFSETSEARQTPADHRPKAEAWVTAGNQMKIGEVGNEEAWISSDFVEEIEQ